MLTRSDMNEDFNRLRLKYHGDSAKLNEILQLECRHKCARKLTETLCCPSFIFPSLALAEMSTSDAVAQVHATMVGRDMNVLDMTAGLGIDAFHFARNGCRVKAIEMSHDAAEALRHNSAELGLSPDVEVIEADSMRWINDYDVSFDVIFIDPARRDTAGRHIALKQCLPDITTSIPYLLTRASRIMVKLSPMIDIKSAKNELGINNCNITVIGTNRECKEVVLTIDADSLASSGADRVNCITIGHGEYIAYGASVIQYALPEVGNYLLQPYPSVMKGTGGVVSDYCKLHPSTHLYVSDTEQPQFPGHHYRIIEIIPFNKREIKAIKSRYPRINVVTRNFPLTAPELVKKLGIKEGGDKMLFGATLTDSSKVLIITEAGFSVDPQHNS